jgi:hypothetical protein
MIETKIVVGCLALYAIAWVVLVYIIYTKAG